MQIRFLHLNINGANYFQSLAKFITQADFDIFCFQEVTGLNTFVGNIYSTRDVFQEISHLLSKTHYGKLAISQRLSSDKKHSYFGNAIFYKKTFSLKQKNILPLYENSQYFPSDSKDYRKIGRNLLHLTLEKEGQIFQILTTHLAWAAKPSEHVYQRQQNTKLISYIKNLSRPFILTGDFNLVPTQPTPRQLEQYASSLTKIQHVKNTLDPQNHAAKKLFPPGLAVDYIYVSPDIRVTNFSILEDIHISDHLALTATIEI